MDPIEFDVVLQLPIPVAVRWADQDEDGLAAGGGADTIILDTDPALSPIGKKIDVWVKGVEFTRKVVAYEPATRTVRVDAPWSAVFADGSFVRPELGSPYAIEVVEIIHLPRLGADGLIPWLDEITEQRREGLRKGIKRAGISGRELAAAEASVELNARAVMTDLNVPVQTPAGIRRVLQLSLARTALPPERQALVLEKLLASGFVAHNLASRLSTLFSTRERRPAPRADLMAEAAAAFPGITVVKKEAADPLAHSGAAPAATASLSIG